MPRLPYMPQAPFLYAHVYAVLRKIALQIAYVYLSEMEYGGGEPGVRLRHFVEQR